MNLIGWLDSFVVTKQTNRHTARKSNRKEDAAARTSEARRKAGDFSVAVIIGLNDTPQNKKILIIFRYLFLNP